MWPTIGNMVQYWSNIGNMVQYWSNIGNMVRYWSNIGHMVQYWSNIGNMVKYCSNIGDMVQYWSNIGNMVQYWSNIGPMSCHIWTGQNWTNTAPYYQNWTTLISRQSPSQYLDALFLKDPQAGMDYHELQVSMRCRPSCRPEIDTTLKPWPNGTPNSSKLEPSFKIKTCIGGWPNGTAKSSQLTRKPFNCLTSTAQSPNNNKTTWRELARVDWGGQTVGYLVRSWAKIWAWSDSNQLDPTQAKWMAKRYPTPSKLWTWLELVWGGSTVWPGLNGPFTHAIFDAISRTKRPSLYPARMLFREASGGLERK